MEDEHDAHRTIRGGSWILLRSSARVSNRHAHRSAPVARYNDLGVRLIRLLNPIEQLAEVNGG